MSEHQLLAVIGLKIKELRISRNMTQSQLAIECDFEKASMSRIESGQTNITIRTLYKISNALGTDIAEFFNE